MCRVTIGHLRVTVGHPRVAIGHLRVTLGYLRVTVRTTLFFKPREEIYPSVTLQFIESFESKDEKLRIVTDR